MSLVSTSISHSSTPQRRKKDVSVTFSRCQVWKEKEGIKRESEKGDLRDLSMYALHNLFICLEEIDRGCSLSGTYWQLHKYLHNFTHRSLTIHLTISGGQFLLSRKNRGVKRLQEYVELYNCTLFKMCSKFCHRMSFVNL